MSSFGIVEIFVIRDSMRFTVGRAPPDMSGGARPTSAEFHVLNYGKLITFIFSGPKP